MSFYRHPYFSLDVGKREVSDENDKPLRITGNPYRLLELLCVRYPTSLTITDINLAFDPAGAREYTEAHVRRMKNVIHTALGREVIQYKNRVYALVGQLDISEGVVERKVSPKKRAPLSRQLKSFSLLKMGRVLRIHAETSDGGRLTYTNDKFEGKL